MTVVSSYQGVIGAWGFSEVMVRAAGPDGRQEAIREASLVGPFVLGVALALAYTAAAHLRRDPERMALILGAMYISAAGWGVHWLAWMLPIALVGGRRWSAVYLAAAAVYTAAIYFGFGGVLWVVVWVTGSFGANTWYPAVSFSMWAGLTVAVALTCWAVLCRELRQGRRNFVRPLFAPPEPWLPGHEHPVAVAAGSPAREGRPLPAIGPNAAAAGQALVAVSEPAHVR